MGIWRFIGIVILTIGTLAGATWPSKGDADFCNQTAAQVGSSAHAQRGSNLTGGRMTDSGEPGIPPSELGMAPVGETDRGYRQAYLSCIIERTR
jgi:hypothetical protein